MLCTDELNAKLLCRQHEEAISNLTAENEKYDRIKVAITQFVEDPTIDSCGIRALKRQLEDYILIIDAIKSANDTDIQEYTQANAFIGDEYLFGRVVTLRRTRRALKVISDDRADYYWGLYRDSLSNPLDSGDYYRERAEHYDKESAAHQAVIDECTRIIDKYDSIENSTYGLLNAASQYRGMIIEAILTMGQAFDGQNYNYYTSGFWRGSLSIDSAKCAEELYELGLTEEQISNMREKGFSYEEIKYCYEYFSSDEDRAFLNCLMEKDYDSAFSKNPLTLSDDMWIFIAEYASRMYRLDDENHYVGTDENTEEIREFQNAIYSHIGKYPKDPKTNMLYSEDYTNCYLRNICGAVAYLEILSTADLASVNPGETGYEEARANYFSKRASMNLLLSERHYFLKTLFQVGYDKLTYFSIESIEFTGSEYNNGIITFSMKHSADCSGGFQTEEIEISPLYNGLSVSFEYDIEALEAESMTYKNTMKNAFGRIVASAGLAAIKAGEPSLAMTMSFIYSLANGSNNLTGYTDCLNQYLVENDKSNAYTSMGVKQAGIVSSGMLSGAIDLLANKDSLSAANLRVYNKWFGCGAKGCVTNGESLKEVNSITFCGEYDPGTMRAVAEWSENGMTWVKFGLQNDNGEKATNEDVWKIVDEKLTAEINELENQLSDPDKKEKYDKLVAKRDTCEKLLLGWQPDIETEGLLSVTDGNHDYTNMENLLSGTEQTFESIKVEGLISGTDGKLDNTDMEIFLDSIEEIQKAGNIKNNTIYKQFIDHVDSYGYYPEDESSEDS